MNPPDMPKPDVKQPGNAPVPESAGKPGADDKKSQSGQAAEIADQGLYRKAAIEHYYAEEESHVDDALQVSRPSDWIVIGTVTVLAVFFLIWAFVGSIPVMVQGTGLIFPAGGVARVVTENGGTVVSPPPANGLRVKKGDLLVKIIPETTRQNFKNAVEHEETAKQNYQAQKSSYETVKKATDEAQNTYLKLMAENLKKLKEIVTDQEKQYQTLKELSSKQMVTTSDLLAAEETAANAYQTYNQAEIQLAQQKVTVQEDLLQQEMSLRAADASYLTAREGRKYQESLLETGEIHAPIDGIVRQCTLGTGDSVAVGAVVCLIESAGPPEMVYQFFSTDDAKRLQVGSLVEIAVVSYPADRYGKLLGRVTAVDPLPATQELIEESCSYSEDLAQSLGNKQAVNLVDILLETTKRDGKTHFVKAGGGSPFPVSSGMVCTGEAVVESQVPITLVIPALKKWFGVTEM